MESNISSEVRKALEEYAKKYPLKEEEIGKQIPLDSKTREGYCASNLVHLVLCGKIK